MRYPTKEELDMTEPDYIVIRPAPDLPPGSIPAHLDGRWYDRSGIPPKGLAVGDQEGDLTARPTGRFEVRDYDGAVAEVWEVRL